MAASCSDFVFSYSTNLPSNISCNSLSQDSYFVNVSSGTSLFRAGEDYSIKNYCDGQEIDTSPASSIDSVNFTLPKSAIDNLPPGNCPFKIYGPGIGIDGCSLSPSITIGEKSYSAEVYISQQRVIDGASQTCYGYPSGCMEAGIPLAIEISNVNRCGSTAKNTKLAVEVSGTGSNETWTPTTNNEGNVPPISYTFSQGGSFQLLIEIYTLVPHLGENILLKQIQIKGPGGCGEQCLTTKPIISSGSGPDPYKICDQIDSSQAHLIDAYNNCIECVGGSETGTDGIWTAIGCIKRDPTEIVQNLLRVGLGMGGGVALLMILAAGFLFSISQGDPKRTGEAKELITAAITGLLFIIFSVVILQFIGYTVLKIPGFGG